MKKTILRTLLAGLVTVVATFWPRDYYFAPCIQWGGLIPNVRPCDSFWVNWWTELGWPEKWFLVVGGGEYGGNLQADSKILAQNLAVNLVLLVTTFKIYQLFSRKWGAKKVVSGLAVIGIVGLVMSIVQSDRFQLFLKPPFPLNEKGARYKIHRSDSGAYVFLGPPATENSSLYSLYYFPRAAGQSPRRIPIFKHPANIDRFESNKQGAKRLKVRGRFKGEIGVVKCSEFPCQKFKVIGIDIDSIALSGN